MKNKLVKRMLSVGLVAAMALALVTGCGKGGDSGDSGENNDASVVGDDEFAGKSTDFTWWITQTDSSGEYYEDYKDNTAVQFINQQYWDVKNGGIGTKETGRKLNFSFLVPVTGSEMENFNTMIGTGEYPDILILAMSSESPQAMYENGVLMEITEYVEKYMPNYLAYLDTYPELKPLVQVTDEDGKAHYYAVYPLTDGVASPWAGMCYRRDWVVKYAEPTEYVWDWESEYVKENGHPAVTPLENAVKEKNMEGWKKNEVTAFESSEGDNPSEDYEDNVIFPSGTSDPLTISDWEWMFEAFDKAFEERSWANDTGAYGVSIQYYGYSQLGEITSSFGGGTGTFYLKDGTVSYDGTSDNFKTYLDCMQVWYENGWLDPSFNTRSGDMFFQIDTTGVNQGKVGMWYGLTSTLGAGIRTSCQNAEDQKDAYVMGAALPLNDVYGGDEQKFADPDAVYQDARRGGPVGITNKAEDKDLATLFTYIDWTYTLEGAKVIHYGLNSEQIAASDLNPNIYEDYDIEAAYTQSTDENGNTVLKTTFDASDPIGGPLSAQRISTGLNLTSNGEYCIVDRGNPMVNQKAEEQWTKYLSTGSVSEYATLLTPEESELYNKVNTACMDYQAQNVPGIIKGTLSWDEYVKGFENIDTETAVSILQKYVK